MEFSFIAALNFSRHSASEFNFIAALKFSQNSVCRLTFQCTCVVCKMVPSQEHWGGSNKKARELLCQTLGRSQISAKLGSKRQTVAAIKHQSSSCFFTLSSERGTLVDQARARCHHSSPLSIEHVGGLGRSVGPLTHSSGGGVMRHLQFLGGLDRKAS